MENVGSGIFARYAFVPRKYLRNVFEVGREALQKLLPGPGGDGRSFKATFNLFFVGLLQPFFMASN